MRFLPLCAAVAALFPLTVPAEAGEPPDLRRCTRAEATLGGHTHGVTICPPVFAP